MTTELWVRRTIRASPERLFAAWTRPSELLAWWGPEGVRCSGAEIDLRVGGRYRIGNTLPDGRELTIVGEFLAIEPPTLLVYTWTVDDLAGAPPEKVTVRFEPAEDGATTVVVRHERIATQQRRRSHEAGWIGCLDGLTRHV